MAGILGRENRVNCLSINEYASAQFNCIWSERVLLSLDFNKQFQGITRI